VQFPDGHVKEYAANALAENIYSQVDAEGIRHLLIDEIINHHQVAVGNHYAISNLQTQ
jgi:hypothetical protein